MKESGIIRRARGLLACAILAATNGAAPAPAAAGVEKMKAEEVVAKHVEAVGAAGTLASIKTRVLTGEVVVTFRSPGRGQVGGRVVLASEGEKNLLGMAFENADYAQEKFGFDGGDVTVGYVRPGVRSPLADFIYTNKVIVRHGLMGGVLSGAWPLFGGVDKKAKLEYGGVKKVGDRQAHELKYNPRGGADVRISLFIDAENFQHLRTVYTRTVAAQMGSSPDASASQRDTRYRMIEDFSDFRKEGGLTMPHGYKVTLEFDTQGGTFAADWEFKLSQFSFNEPIAPGSFKVT